MRPIIRTEGLGKQYVIRHLQFNHFPTLRDEFARAARTLAGRVGASAGRLPEQERFWALRDVNLEVRKGERVGIIGRNGSGKSTLLKLLSRITEPTAGKFTLRGRVASLLEVGTGFHPELTGRENIFLNGAVLGMRREETRRKFDEIVEFAEIERFLDTPIKRYSSGMYMRLAFAVAAHLEPDVLIVDEVLAVGDIQFQRKCLGKMEDVSRREDRTVLFVSHSMDAIERLCPRCMLLDGGRVVMDAATSEVVPQYLATHGGAARPGSWIDLAGVRRQGTGEARFAALRFLPAPGRGDGRPVSGGALEVEVAVESARERTVGSLSLTIFSLTGAKLVNADVAAKNQSVTLREGRTVVRFSVDALHLNPGTYVVGLWASTTPGVDTVILDYLEAAADIEVIAPSPDEVRLEEDGFVRSTFRVTRVD